MCLNNDEQYENHFNEKRFEEKQKEIQFKMLQSTQKSLRVLEKSEKVAVSTTKELSVQHEQLKKLNYNLNDMNSTLKKNSENINIVKSNFGFIKNFINNKKICFPFKGKPKYDNKNDTFSNPKSADVENVTFLLSDKYSKETKNTLPHNEQELKCSRDDFNGKINDNLQDISLTIRRLKGIALEMGKELDTQNDLIENITAKTEKATVTLQDQNQSIKKLL